MPPLARSPTGGTIHSYWSDSNPFLLCNPIHAGAKPLMKLMYHRKIVNSIKRQRGIPLSRETMDIYASYLGWGYVSDLTKTKILRDLHKRAQDEAEAQAIMGSPFAFDIVLYSPNTSTLTWTCSTLARLACHDSTLGTVVDAGHCQRLVALLRCGLIILEKPHFC
ncbi:hypothetical protein C8R43DRAFT_991720 [Mycena crocata]|nr:hypothetical protein C8R43DRAFT_991720 [Mycena crocata]